MRNKHFNSHLADVLDEKGITQTQLAQQTGFSLRCISFWVAGYGISLKNAMKIAGILGCEISDIWEPL